MHVPRRNRVHFTVMFQPLNFVKDEDLSNLKEMFASQRVVVPMSLKVLQRRNDFAVALTPGIFANNFNDFESTYATDAAQRDAIIAKIKETYPFRAWRPGRAIIERDGQLYYHRDFVALLREHAPHPAFFQALYAFLNAARADSALIKGPRRPRTVLPPAQRVRVAGRLTRGLGWTPNEDQVLRQWFGIRTVGDHAGHHAPLTEAEWARVLELLGDMRTRRSILQRITVLNLAVKREFSVDGYIPRARVREYMARALGERPRFPRLAPSRKRA
jgi:hypothetical protein